MVGSQAEVKEGGGGGGVRLGHEHISFLRLQRGDAHLLSSAEKPQNGFCKLIGVYTPWMVLFKWLLSFLHGRQRRGRGAPRSYRGHNGRPSEFGPGFSQSPAAASWCSDSRIGLILGIPKHTRFLSALLLATIFHLVSSFE